MANSTTNESAPGAEIPPSREGAWDGGPLSGPGGGRGGFLVAARVMAESGECPWRRIVGWSPQDPTAEPDGSPDPGIARRRWQRERRWRYLGESLLGADRPCWTVSHGARALDRGLGCWTVSADPWVLDGAGRRVGVYGLECFPAADAGARLCRIETDGADVEAAWSGFEELGQMIVAAVGFDWAVTRGGRGAGAVRLEDLLAECAAEEMADSPLWRGEVVGRLGRRVADGLPGGPVEVTCPTGRALVAEVSWAGRLAELGSLDGAEPPAARPAAP